MLKIGLLVGREWSFPPAFIEEVRRRNAGVVAEHLAAFSTCDWKRLMAQFPDNVEFFAPNGDVVRGRQALGRLLPALHDQFPGQGSPAATEGSRPSRRANAAKRAWRAAG